MEKTEEELSVDEVLSSIRTAVLETKSPSDDEKKEEEKKQQKKVVTKEHVFVLSKDMLVDNSANVSLSENDFDKTSENLLKKYAKVFATWQAFEQNQKE